MDILEDDRIYYDESGGGVTFSGGEPFTQPDFLRELLLECRERELKVVLDTSGHVLPETFQELAPLASGLLFDLKVMDEARHEAFTGVHNRWILENLRWAAASAGDGGADLTVRIPLIPGVNDDDESLESMAAFLSGLAPLPPVDLLPYHRLGVDKYERSGREYFLGMTKPPTTGTISRAVGILETAGLTVTVRGEPNGND
jgi:pyruvate formate lyase activating enzyme